MIEESIIKSNFIGRDGFRWWIGQVAPEEAQGDQLNQIGDAWGNRVKVRIMGYHPQNTTELSDDDLPWAQVLLSPQAGSGKANRAKSLRLSPGDSVVGFFLDGDDAQLPVIMGIFGSTAYSPSETYKGPFQPFTGYTSKVKSDSAFILKNEVGDQSGNTAQKSPRGISQAKIDNLNASIASSYFSSFKSIVPLLNNALGLFPLIFRIFDKADIPDLTPQRYGDYMRYAYQNKGLTGLGLVKGTMANLEGNPELSIVGFPIGLQAGGAVAGGAIGLRGGLRNKNIGAGRIAARGGGYALAGALAGKLSNMAIASANRPKYPTTLEYQ